VVLAEPDHLPRIDHLRSLCIPGIHTQYVHLEKRMSVPHALLALLREGPKYGLRLQNEFESRTGEVWPLNIGQVYTTLQRLERDGSSRPPARANGRRSGTGSPPRAPKRSPTGSAPHPSSSLPRATSS
jgi:hypothetical protein